MPMRYVAVLTLSLVLAAPTLADDAAEARSIVDKAIEAMGGAQLLEKYKAFAAKIKGDLYAEGASIPFLGELASQGADQEKIRLELNIDGQAFVVSHVVNRDRGWVKLGEETSEMDREALAEAREQAHVAWVASLVPLKDKSFTLATVGEVEVDGKRAVGVRVSHPARRDVNLFFDKANYLLVKTESRVRDEESGQEMTEETFLSGYDGQDIQTALKIRVTRDGNPYVDAELSEIQYLEGLDDSVFGRP